MTTSNSTPCVIWALPRTGSTTLAHALGALNEPFHCTHSWRYSTAAQIEALCATRASIKHIYEECPDESNLALARAANRHGYRHIHLVRCNEFARLVSRDIAAQQVAWIPETATAKFTLMKHGRGRLAPLDIDNLLRLQRLSDERWESIRPQIAYLTVRFEDLTSIDSRRRHQALRQLAAFLALPPGRLARMDRAFMRGGQRTGEISRFVPNLAQLAVALGAVR